MDSGICFYILQIQKKIQCALKQNSSTVASSRKKLMNAIREGDKAMNF